jgi:RNA polymerase sigma-70 factor (ECF subfamily)
VSETDRQLIEQFIGGQTEAFGTLVLRHQDRLFNSLLRVVGSRDEASDIAQDAFLNAYRKIESFRGDAAFYSWLFRIAMNVALTRKRKQKRAPTSLDAIQDAAGDQTVDQNPSSRPSSRMELTERQQAVRAALDSLSEEFRIVMVLKEIEGLKYDQIAEIVGCPVGTVRSRIHRARMELRERLQRHLNDD